MTSRLVIHKEKKYIYKIDIKCVRCVLVDWPPLSNKKSQESVTYKVSAHE